MQYGQMKTLFLSILNRTDCTPDLTDTFFSQSLARCQRELRLPHMERVFTLDTTLEVSELQMPSDWLETITFYAGCEELRYMDIGSFIRKPSPGPVALYYTRTGPLLKIKGSIQPGTDAKFIYFGTEDGFDTDTTETTLSAIAPDLIVYGALTYAGDHFIDDRTPTWEQKWTFFQGQIQDQADEGEMNTGSNQVEPAYPLCDGA